MAADHSKADHKNADNWDAPIQCPPLKDCPFCAKPAEMHRYSDVGFFVKCSKCFADAPTEATMEKARARWNSRPLERCLKKELDLAKEKLLVAIIGHDKEIVKCYEMLDQWRRYFKTIQAVPNIFKETEAMFADG